MDIRLLVAILAGLLLGAAPAAAQNSPAEPSPYTIHVRDGSIIQGRLTGISEGLIQWAAPWQEGAASARADALEYIDLTDRDVPRHERLIRLSTGEVISGTLKRLDSTELVVMNELFGELLLPRGALAQVVSGMTGELLYESDLADGPGRWEPVAGEWEFSGGMAVGSTKRVNEDIPGFPRIALPLEQSGPTTFELQLKPLARGRMLVFVSIFAADKHGSEALSVHTRLDGYTVKVGDAPMRSDEVPEEDRVAEPVWRIGWDPGEERCIIWHEDKEVGRHDLRRGPKSGDFLALYSLLPFGVRWLRVHGGIVGPAGLEADAQDDNAVLILENGDRVSVSDLSISEGRVAVQMAGAEAEFDMDKLQRIITALKDRAAPETPADAAMVHTTHGRVLLSEIAMNAESLSGTSPGLGQVVVPRGGVRMINWAEADRPASAEEKTE